MNKYLYKIYGNSIASGWMIVGEEYTEQDAIETGESISPEKYYQYIIIGYDLSKNEPIFTKSRFLDYDKPITLKKEVKKNEK